MGYNQSVVINGISFNFARKSENEARIEIAPATSNATPIRFQGTNNIGIIFTDDAKDALRMEVGNLYRALNNDRPNNKQFVGFKMTVGQSLVSGIPYIDIKASEQTITGDIPEGYGNYMDFIDGAVYTMMNDMYFA